MRRNIPHRSGHIWQRIVGKSAPLISPPAAAVTLRALGPLAEEQKEAKGRMDLGGCACVQQPFPSSRNSLDIWRARAFKCWCLASQFRLIGRRSRLPWQQPGWFNTLANMMWARYPRVLTTNLLSNDEASGSTGSCSGVTCTSATLLALQLSAEHLRLGPGWVAIQNCRCASQQQWIFNRYRQQCSLWLLWADLQELDSIPSADFPCLFSHNFSILRFIHTYTIWFGLNLKSPQCGQRGSRFVSRGTMVLIGWCVKATTRGLNQYWFKLETFLHLTGFRSQ